MRNTLLDFSQLYKPCHIERLQFHSTEEFEYINITVGQKHAVEATKLGIQMHKSGYNIYLMALSGSGKLTP